MVKIMENPIFEWMILGVPLFLETPGDDQVFQSTWIWICFFLQIFHGLGDPMG